MSDAEWIVMLIRVNNQYIIVAFGCGSSFFYAVYFTRNGMEYTRLKFTDSSLLQCSFEVLCLHSVTQTEATLYIECARNRVAGVTRA
jgi:uncharacterized membrane protein